MNDLFTYDYTFCAAECSKADCFRNRCNLPKGRKILISMADLSKDSSMCPLLKGEEDNDDETV